MSLKVKLGKKPSEQELGGWYPQAHHSYRATISDITSENAKNKDFIKVQLTVDGPNGETYDEENNGPAIFDNEYFDANVSRLIRAAVESPENKGTLDPAIVENMEPDLSELVGSKIGVTYDRQYNNPQFASVDRVHSTEMATGLISESDYKEWLEIRKASKKDSDSGKKPGGKGKAKTNPFANRH